jgi:hypothetical protein
MRGGNVDGNIEARTSYDKLMCHGKVTRQLECDW